MAGEWSRATWSYSPVALGHTPGTIVKALHSFLTQLGWEPASWAADLAGVNLTDRYYLRADRSTASLVATVVGTAHNVAITKTGGNITVAGMSGGGASAKAAGSVNLTNQPADGNTITINDGTTTVIFEFDNNSSVSGVNVPVVIGTTRLQTIDNLITAINSAGLTIAATILSDTWRYNGDGPEQACGLHVKYNSGNSTIEVGSFLQNAGGTASQIETTLGQRVIIAYDNSVANDFLLVGGEDGFFLECGRDGTQQNLAHGVIATFKAIPEFAGSRDAQVKWMAQGLVMDLFGNLKFSTDHNARFVDNNGSNKNYTALLKPEVPRGSPSVIAAAPVNNQRFFVIPRDNQIGSGWIGGSLGNSFDAYFYNAAFGLINSPFDDRYKICPIWMHQHLAYWNVSTSDGSGSLTSPASGGFTEMIEPRWLRQLNRLVACDQTLLPFNQIVDTITGKTYRITQIADGGRTTNLGIEYPASAITVPATPTT